MTAQYQVSPASSVGPRMVETRLFDKARRRQVSAPGLWTLLEIMDLWGLSEADLMRVLGPPGLSAIARATSNPYGRPVTRESLYIQKDA